MSVLKKDFTDKGKDMKKVLVIGMSSNLGGVENFIINYFRNIDRSKIHMDFLLYEKHCVYEEEIKREGSVIYTLEEPRYKHCLLFSKHRKKLFKVLAKKYDYIWQNDCSLANAYDLEIARRCGFENRIFHSHNSKGMRKDAKKYFYQIIHHINKKHIRKWASLYWACSDEAARFCFDKDIILEGKYQIIPNAIEMDRFYFNKKIRDKYRTQMNLKDEIVLGCVGRLHFQKNQKFLLEVFREIRDINNKTRLWLIGEGEDREFLERRTKELGLENDVKFLGRREDVADLMQVMDIFVLPSVFEGFGIVLIEAQAAGLRVFASDKVIPACVKISSLLEFIDLSVDSKEWARIICDKIYYDRKNMESELKNCKYNIKYMIKEFEENILHCGK